MTYGVIPPAGLRFSLDAGIPQSYPFKLQALMAQRYTTQSVAVYNDGGPGNKVSQERTRFNDDVKTSGPQLILLMEGANDLNEIAAAAAAGVQNTNQLVDNVVGMMEDIVRDAIERRSIPVILATLPPQRLPKGAATAFIGRYNNGLKTMAAKKGATLVDFGAQIPDSMISSDGLHPNEAGYQRMAELMFDAIKTKYEAAATAPSVAFTRR